jgi:hypothetical protein
MDGLPGPLALLEAGIPLTLLIDVLTTAAPASREILVTEAGDASWLVRVTTAA